MRDKKCKGNCQVWFLTWFSRSKERWEGIWNAPIQSEFLYCSPSGEISLQLSLPNYFCVTLWTQNSYVRLCDGWGHFNDFFFSPIFQVYFIAYFLSFVVCQIKLHTATHSACISICCSCDQCEIAAWRDYRVCQLPCLNVPWWIVLHY